MTFIFISEFVNFISKNAQIESRKRKMFTSEFREKVREEIIANAKLDGRISSAAEVGSYARNAQDRWSDIDLTFGFDDTVSIDTILNSWTEYVSSQFSGVPILDIQRGKTIYRVFILPGCLQVDLSFTPQTGFGSAGPDFMLHYGRQDKNTQITPPNAAELYGYMVHHLVRVRICIERNRLWQAEFWLNEARNYALKLCCLFRGLKTDHGRGFDDLPSDILEPYKNSFVKQPTREEITKGLSVILSQLDNISPEVNLLNGRLRKQLLDLNIYH